MTMLQRASLIIILNEMFIRIIIAIIMCVFIIKKKIIKNLIALIVISFKFISLQ